jgi:hypothetical protein
MGELRPPTGEPLTSDGLALTSDGGASTSNGLALTSKHRALSGIRRLGFAGARDRCNPLKLERVWIDAQRSQSFC